MAAVSALGAAYAGALAAAATGSGWGVAGALAAAAVVDAAGLVRSPEACRRLEAFGTGARLGVGQVALVLLAGRSTTTAVLVGTGIAATAIIAAAALRRAAAAAVAHLRRPPLLSRNLPLVDLRVPPAPHPRLQEAAGFDSVVAVVAAVGLAVAGTSRPWAAAAGLAAATVVAVAPAVVLAGHALRLHRAGTRGAVVTAVTDAVERLRPEVVVYFAATAEETYQPEMWLEPVERLGRPAAVIVRDHRVLHRLADTDLPVVCTPYNGTLANLPLPASVVTLFVTHSGNNLAMLRRREVRSVFVGHGDSDKPDSVNPFARVYEQVWVAGPLGRRRYDEAGVGVRPEAVVEIGRPQLRSTGHAPQVPTLLYAPTWEGWGDDPHHSSLPHVGPDLVRDLLGRRDLRVLYRPHPLTGRRDPRLRRAHGEILRLLRAAGAVGVRLPASTRDRNRADLLDDAVRTGRDPRRPARGTREALAAAAWAAADPDMHRIVEPDGPDLASCFAETSVLVADVSSVASDFLVVDRPYAVADTRGLGAAALARQFPAARGAVVLGPDLAGLDDLCEIAVGARPDPTARARRALARAALGDPATAQQRFAAAVDGLLQPR